MGESLELMWRNRRGSGLLFMIHGFGEHPASALMLGGILDPAQRLTLCAPLGPMDLGQERRTFYGVDFQAKRLDAESHAVALIQIDAALTAACEHAQISRSDAIVAGFSQGGGLALTTAFSHGAAEPPAAVIVFNGLVYDDEFVDWDFGHRDTQVFWWHGQDDDRFSIGSARDSIERMQHEGASVTKAEGPGGHVLTPAGLAAAGQWLTRMLPDRP